MTTDSSTGGYLLGKDVDNTWLTRFVHDFVAGVCGLDRKQVRPIWQPEPPKFNTRAQTWAAFGIISKTVTGSSSKRVLSDTQMEVRFWETIDFVVQVYGPKALDVAEQFRNNCYIGQNREELLKNGMTIKEVKPITRIPELLDDGWIDRCDSGALIMRDNIQRYDILPMLSVQGSLTESRAGVNTPIRITE